jgi:pimeloyl-ACP methyl ester carboxylesterase
MLMQPSFTRRKFLVGALSAGFGAFAPGASKGVTPPTSSSRTLRWLTLPTTPALPATSRKGLASINGVKNFYAQFGSGPSVLLLHGGSANSNWWGNQIEYLSAKYSVTVMDTRGHGRSPLLSNNMNYEAFAKDAVALMDYLEISRTAIIGWSDGAITGLQLALTQPGRLSGLFAFGANSNLGGLKRGGAKTGVFPMFSARCHEEYKELAPNPAKWSELQRLLSIMWRSEPNFSKAQLATIAVATTIADGEFDEIIKPANTREIAESIKDAKLIILSQVSHFAMLQDPTGFNAAINAFLSG